MIKVLFVCLGNICRSPMAEYVLKDMVKKKRNRRRILYRLCSNKYRRSRKYHTLWHKK